MYMQIDLNKSLEFFNPTCVTKKVHIIGCGAVGSHVAELLARLGITNIHLWDDDKVSTHNIANQNFVFEDCYRPKVEVVAERIKAINPDCKVTIHNNRWVPRAMMTGYVFMCVDSIEPRKQMCQFAKTNDLTIIDIRMGLTSGQYYIVPHDALDIYAGTMNFTDEEADKYTPKSACNFELSVAYSIYALLGYMMSDVVDMWQNYPEYKQAVVDMQGGVTRF